MIVLIGFMGAGKTTVGSLLADRLGTPFVDTDREIERVAGARVAEIFSTQGEAAFRELERDVVAATLERKDAVIALGGGALGDPASRAALEWADVVLLDVSFGEAMRRVGQDASRPLLQGDAKALYDERQATYRRAARISIDTDGRGPDEIVDEIAARLGGAPAEARVEVKTSPPYGVTIGAGLLQRFAELIPGPAPERVAIVTHPGLRSYAELVAESFRETPMSMHEVPAGERSKSLSTAAELYDAFAKENLHRSDLVVGVGGGVICDLTGFVASTFHRGVAVAYAPTSLLAQVDAAIGGKTAVDLEAGKNLVGTFHQPLAVLCDIETLGTLPDEEFVNGLAEVAKYGFIADPGLLDVLSSRVAAVRDRDPTTVRSLIVRSVALKAAVVTADEKESGLRAILNYGHTLGHAFEHLSAIRHGEAISLGMMAAAYLGHELGFLEEDAVGRHRTILEGLGLPVAVNVGLDEIEGTLLQDKKARTTPRFVVLKALGIPVTGIEVPRDVLERALKRLEA